MDIGLHGNGKGAFAPFSFVGRVRRISSNFTENFLQKGLTKYAVYGIM